MDEIYKLLRNGDFHEAYVGLWELAQAYIAGEVQINVWSRKKLTTAALAAQIGRARAFLDHRDENQVTLGAIDPPTWVAALAEHFNAESRLAVCTRPYRFGDRDYHLIPRTPAQLTASAAQQAGTLADVFRHFHVLRAQMPTPPGYKRQVDIRLRVTHGVLATQLTQLRDAPNLRVWLGHYNDGVTFCEPMQTAEGRFTATGLSNEEARWDCLLAQFAKAKAGRADFSISRTHHHATLTPTLAKAPRRKLVARVDVGGCGQLP